MTPIIGTPDETGMDDDIVSVIICPVTGNECNADTTAGWFCEDHGCAKRARADMIFPED